MKKGLAAVRDEEGNVIIDKAGSAGHEDAPRTILQAHMDMVVVWEDGMDFDPLNDTITVINDGKTLKAKGTSLGGDDGAGVALAMSILEDETAVHGPIRAIFTVDEEDGMSGADHLDPKHLDAKYLINLDWEEFGSLCNSSAGSDMYRMHRAAEWEAASGKAYKIAVSGLVGGHSGASIHLKLANAIRIAARTAKTALDMCPGARLAAFRGGSAHNAIPASCTAVITVPEKDAEKVLEALNAHALTEAVACAATDPEARVAVTAAELPEKALTGELSRGYLALLTEVFDGVHTMSPSIPSLVEHRPCRRRRGRSRIHRPSAQQRTRHHRGNEEGIRASGIRARLYDDAAQFLPCVAAQARQRACRHLRAHFQRTERTRNVC